MKDYILVCDDDEGIKDVVSIVLKEKGYAIKVCSDSGSIMDTIKTHPPALIIMDLWMPGVGGEQITIDLKSNRETKDIPIVIVSANKDIKKITKYSGANSYLSKPFDIEDLEKIAAKYLPSSI